MRKLVIGMAMASTVLASPALARDGQWYAGISAGPSILEDTDFDVNDTGSVTVSTKSGYDVGGLVGYDFGSFRLEAEASYRQGDVKKVIGVVTGIPNASNGVSTGRFSARGDANALSFMLNGLFDFGPDDGLQSYVGGGIGVARTEYEANVSTLWPSAINDSDSGLAWQLLAGVRAPLTDNIDAGLRYRYYTSDGVSMVDEIGRDFDGDFKSHSLLGTLTYNFGGEVETQSCWDGSVIPVSQACPARIAEATQTCWNGSVIPVSGTCPAKPEPPVCKQGPYIVFFEWDKSDVTPDAATILNSAVSAYANCGTASVMLAGHTDTSGTTTYNEGLASRRNASVREYLSGRGIPSDRISSEAFGETQLRVPTANGVRELQNRRVEVTYGPGSGM